MVTAAPVNAAELHLAGGAFGGNPISASVGAGAGLEELIALKVGCLRVGFGDCEF